MAAMFRRNMTLEQINEAKSIYDLIPMLHVIGLSTIQDILTQKVKQMDVTDISNLFLSSLSIEKVLPLDVIGHITSFQNMSQIKCVSRTFNKCYQQNRKREIQKREKHIASTLHNDDNRTTTTHVVDPTRTELNDNEKRLKYNGPLNDLSNAVKMANDGDTILIHNGTYGYYDEEGDWEENPMCLLNVDKAIQIVGIGDNVVIQYTRIEIGKHVYLKNIKIKICSGINVTSECELFMQDCNVDFPSCTAIDCSSNCVIDINDCNFYGGKNALGAIYIDAKVKSVSITHCVINGCGSIDGEPCICTNTCGDLSDVYLKLIDNLFVNNHGLPIGYIHSDMPYIHYQNKVRFEGNRMKRRRDIMWQFIMIYDHYVM
eukprot:129651_1